MSYEFRDEENRWKHKQGYRKAIIILSAWSYTNLYYAILRIVCPYTHNTTIQWRLLIKYREWSYVKWLMSVSVTRELTTEIIRMGRMTNARESVVSPWPEPQNNVLKPVVVRPTWKIAHDRVAPYAVKSKHWKFGVDYCWQRASSLVRSGNRGGIDCQTSRLKDECVATAPSDVPVQCAACSSAAETELHISDDTIIWEHDRGAILVVIVG